MNHFKIGCSLVAALLILGSGELIAQPYEWKIKPGTPEWKVLQTHDEMLKVLQIPTNVLETITTKDLVTTCLEYPLFTDMWAFNSLELGIETGISSFNGFQELLKREGAAVEVLRRYQAVDLTDLETKQTAIDRGVFKIGICKLELLLSRESMLRSLGRDGRLSLLSECLKKSKAIQASNKYSFFSRESCSFLAVRILTEERVAQLTQKEEENKNLTEFRKHGTGATRQTMIDISEIADHFLKQNN